MIEAVLTVGNMSWVANLAIFIGIVLFCRSFWYLLLEEDTVALFVVLSELPGGGFCVSASPCKSWPLLLRLRNTSALSRPLEACEGLNAQEKAELVVAATGHHFEDVMATYHPPGPSDSFGRNMVLNVSSATSAVSFMIFGDPDSPLALLAFWHVVLDPRMQSQMSTSWWEHHWKYFRCILQMSGQSNASEATGFYDPTSCHQRDVASTVDLRVFVNTLSFFEDTMTTYHQPGIAGEGAGKSSNIRWAIRQPWKKFGVAAVCS